ncbi:Uncharacterised protein [Neisseria meningitidis]|nr:Uncharacterised protein [Neisseria meningitidis]CWN08660.1 Uncharacterised protein [Neisseria meningitidis]CWN08913.1 Uncharacterised protein [Neisseria meningitidis]CWN33710.1 Uncharacterised protein [Neisseria meningitidis]CWN42590.1 Uncharacterised protein [Neisseria meningitidis]
MLIRSFGVDAGVDTRFGFFCSPACSGKLSRFVGDVYVAGVDAAAGGAVFAVSVAAVAGCRAYPVGRPALFVGNRAVPAAVQVETAAYAEASAFVAAVVLNVAMGEGGRLKAVFPFAFGTSGGGDDTALEVCVVSDFDLIAVFSGINTALLGYGGMVCFDFALAVTAACTESVTDSNLDIAVLLFALIGFSILNTFYMQVARICLYAFADELRTFEGGIPAAADGGLSGCAADMGVAVGSISPLLFTFTDISSGGNSKPDAVAYFDGYACIPTTAFVFALLAAVLFGRLESDMVVGNEGSTCMADDIGTCNIDIGLLPTSCCRKCGLPFADNLTCCRFGVMSFLLVTTFLFAVGDGHTDTGALIVVLTLSRTAAWSKLLHLLGCLITLPCSIGCSHGINAFIFTFAHILGCLYEVLCSLDNGHIEGDGKAFLFLGMGVVSGIPVVCELYIYAFGCDGIAPLGAGDGTAGLSVAVSCNCNGVSIQAAYNAACMDNIGTISVIGSFPVTDSKAQSASTHDA